MRITDVITKKRKEKKLDAGEQNSPMEQADWEKADELMNDENGFVNPKNVPAADKYIRASKKKAERHQRRQ